MKHILEVDDDRIGAAGQRRASRELRRRAPTRSSSPRSATCSTRSRTWSQARAAVAACRSRNTMSARIASAKITGG